MHKTQQAFEIAQMRNDAENLAFIFDVLSEKLFNNSIHFHRSTVFDPQIIFFVSKLFNSMQSIHSFEYNPLVSYCAPKIDFFCFDGCRVYEQLEIVSVSQTNRTRTRVYEEKREREKRISEAQTALSVCMPPNLYFFFLICVFSVYLM